LTEARDAAAAGEDESDLQFAIDRIFRLEHNSDRDDGNYVYAIAALQGYAEELRKRGWKWDAERTPTVWKENT